jgi:DNA-binding NarL/FixJ family response regulator
MVGKEAERHATLRGGKPVDPTFCTVIVDRDSMSSDLLADALIRDLRCSAIAVRSSNLLQTLASRNVNLVAISADLNGKAGLGFDLVRSVACAYPGIPIVVLLDHVSPKAVISAFRSGARGLFCRQEPMAEFLDCVRHVKRGFLWAAGEEANALLGAIKRIPAPMELTEDNAALLTTRELQVVRHAATGKKNRTIAHEMGLSEHTVKNYLFRAFEKLGVTSRVELLFYMTNGRSSFAPIQNTEAQDSALLEHEAS